MVYYTAWSGFVEWIIFKKRCNILNIMKEKLPPISGSVYRVYDRKEHEWVRLYTGRWEFLFVLQGRLQLSYNGHELELSAAKNNFLIYKPGFSYHFKAYLGTTYVYVNFDLRGELEEQVQFCESLDGLGCFTLSRQNLRRIKRDMLEIIQLTGKHCSNTDSLAMRLAEGILFRVCISPAENSVHSPKLLKAFLLLSKMTDIPINTVAKQCGLSIPVLYKLFKQETGTTPGIYRENIKLHEAARLLRETAMTLGEIASELNMYDQYYLSKRFKKFYNISPSVYRKKCSLE